MWLVHAAALLVILPGIICPPVTKPPDDKQNPDDVQPVNEDVNFGLEYERYLKEVVNILETDETFRKKLEESNISDIKSGEIARHLEFVSHGVRTKLDELKRQEMERLRQLQRIKTRHMKGIPSIDLQKMVGHVDHKNPETFEISDLAKLIKKATADLEEIDKKRKDEFKRYEMEKEHLQREKLKALDEQHKQQEMERLESLKKKHKDHPKLHHPGSKDQLEEVWEESDGLSKDEFDPKTFFMLHDSNSDGFWDEVEIEALFQKELDKMYDPNAPEDDMMERYEEMSRMREHVVNEVDKNKDKLVSLDEFIQSTKTGQFEKDDGWEGLDEDDDLFTEEELQQFEREYERQRMQGFQQGHVQPGEINYHGQGQGQQDPQQQFQQQQFQQQQFQQQQFQQQQFQQPPQQQFQQPPQQQFQQPPQQQFQQPQQQQFQQPPQQQFQQPPQQQFQQPVVQQQDQQQQPVVQQQFQEHPAQNIEQQQLHHEQQKFQQNVVQQEQHHGQQQHEQIPQHHEQQHEQIPQHHEQEQAQQQQENAAT